MDTLSTAYNICCESAALHSASLLSRVIDEHDIERNIEILNCVDVMQKIHLELKNAIHSFESNGTPFPEPPPYVQNYMGFNKLFDNAQNELENATLIYESLKAKATTDDILVSDELVALIRISGKFNDIQKSLINFLVYGDPLPNVR